MSKGNSAHHRWKSLVIVGLIVSTFTSLAAEAEPKINGETLTLANADAWNFRIARQTALPVGCSRPTFSPDFSKLAFGYLEFDGSHVAKRFIVVKNIDDWKTIKQLEVPIVIRSVAFSPDSKTLACASDFSNDPEIIFVDLETDKITPIEGRDIRAAGQRVTWPNQSNIYIHDRLPELSQQTRSLNLDTLKVSRIPDNLNDHTGKDTRVSSHKKVNIAFRDLLNNESKQLVVDSKTEPYGRVFIPEVRGENGCGWTPNLEYLFWWEYHDDYRDTCTVYKFAVRATPSYIQNDFRLKWLESSLSDEERKLISEAISSKKRVGFTMYHAKKNPLNGKIIGPDRRIVLGRGIIKSISDGARVSYGLEYLSVSEGDVASDFWILNGQTFHDAWAAVSIVTD